MASKIKKDNNSSIETIDKSNIDYNNRKAKNAVDYDMMLFDFIEKEFNK